MDGQTIASDGAERPWQGDLCQFFTRDKVARFCLQQVEWPADILSIKLLDPAAGHGAFVLPIIPLLARACRARRKSFAVLRTLIRAYEIDRAVAKSLAQNCVCALRDSGVPITQARELVRYWIKVEDFLEKDIRCRFTHVLGNPPYIRWDSIPLTTRESYKERFSTFKQRADVYVAFIERALGLLQPNGQLGFLCPGAWTKNGYGGAIRELMTSRGYLRKIIDFSDVDSFERAADAYPHFFIFEKGSKGSTQIFSMLDADELLPSGRTVRRRFEASSKPLLLARNEGIEAVLKVAQAKFPLLEDAGCSVRVGSATGCNDVFLGRAGELPVEPDRQLPFVNARSIRNGIVEWSGTNIVNVFDGRGHLVKLADFPRLRKYLHCHKDVLQARAKASKSTNWWRSIDTLQSEWYRSPKVLVVDISAKPVIGLDEIGYCAGSGVYQIKSNEWPLRDLLILLSAGILGLFVSALSVGASSGFHRFQKRQICSVRIPKWKSLDGGWRRKFQDAYGHGELRAAVNCVAELYECKPGLLIDFAARDWSSFANPRKAR